MLDPEGEPSGSPFASSSPVLQSSVRLADLLSITSGDLCESIKRNLSDRKPTNEELQKLESELYKLRIQFKDNIEVQAQISQCFFNIRKIYNYTNKYEITSFPPFLTIIHSQSALHPMNVGKILFENKVDGIQKIESKGRNRMGVYFNFPENANKFLKIDNLIQKNWNVQIPLRMTTCRGIVWNMGDEIEEEDIVNYGIGIRGNQQLKVLNARRIYKRIYTGGYASKVKTNGFVITFKGNAIPLEFALYNTINNVSPYKNPVILCKNCYRFGHCANQCRSSSRCQACGETQ